MTLATTAKLTIRDSRMTDIPAITAIYAEAVLHGTGTFEIDPSDAGEMAKRREAILAGGYPYLIAEQDGQIAGFCYANYYRTRPAYRFSVEDSVYVAPEWRGRKIGLCLLDNLIERCEHAGYRLMIAVIGDSENLPSIRLHAAAGFQHAGTLPSVGWKFERWLDTVFMTRALDKGAAQPPHEIR
jgi:phosphinothricin acetyltransferase